MTEDEERAMVVVEAEKWIGTPYHTNGDVLGAGIDCGMLLVRAFVDTRIVKPFDPRPYPAQWAFHQSAELYLGIVESLSREIEGPPKPADLVLFRFGKCWAHGGIVKEWPIIIHSNPTTNPFAQCRYEDCSKSSDLFWRKPRFFSPWPRVWDGIS
jgi:cell wall-associated NlpC family hydrolase